MTVQGDQSGPLSSASLKWKMDPWKPPHLKGKKCLPLLAHRTRPTWYLSDHVFNTANVYPSYFWKNYDKTSHNCTSNSTNYYKRPQRGKKKKKLSSCRRTFVTPRPKGAVRLPNWTASSQSASPSAPRFLLTLMPTRTAYLRKAARKAKKKVTRRSSGPGACLKHVV